MLVNKTVRDYYEKQEYEDWMLEDCSDLSGVEIRVQYEEPLQFLDENNGVECVIAVMEYGVGITIVNKHDPNDYIICNRGPQATNAIYKNVEEIIEHNKIFKYVLDTIKTKDILYVKQLTELALSYRCGGTTTAELCPFNQ